MQGFFLSTSFETSWNVCAILTYPTGANLKQKSRMIRVSSIACRDAAGCQPVTVWFQIIFTVVGFDFWMCFLISMFIATYIQAVFEQVSAQSIFYIFLQWIQRSTTPRLKKAYLTCTWDQYCFGCLPWSRVVYPWRTLWLWFLASLLYSHVWER